MQAVRVQPRHDADGIRTGRYLRGQRVKELAAQPEVGEFQGGVLVIHPVHGVGRLAGLGAEQGTDLCLPCPHGLCGFQRAPAADDAQAHAALIVFGGQDLDLAHRAGKGGVGAAAGTDIRPGDGHDPHLPLDLLFGAVGQDGQLLPGGVGDVHRYILPDDAVGGSLGRFQPLGGDGDVRVHPHGIGADVEAHVLGPEHLVQDAGKDVLAGVLLHFVKAPFPVDAAGNGSAGNSAFRQSVHAVPEDAVMLVHIGHIQRGAVRQGQGAPVGRLTAAFRVEHRTFQRDESAAGTAVRHGGQQDAFGPGAEGIRFKIFFSALHGA